MFLTADATCNDVMCCVCQKKFAVTFASEAEPQLFLVCSKFLDKFAPCCSFKIVLAKKKRVLNG